MINNECLLSVIVPVHNVEKYLEKCILSILKQTYYNIEIVLVDDGSTDESLNICKRLQKQDDRIRVFHYDHSGGAARARKKGAELSKGDYIAYVDSDDWIDENCFETLMGLILENDADMAVSTGMVCEYPKGNHKTPPVEVSGVYDKDMMEEICRKYILIELNPTLCNTVFKRTMHEKYQQKMDDRIWVNNDITCTTMTVANIDKLVVTNEYFYHYRENPNSIVHSYKSEYLLSNLLSYQLVKNELEINNYDKLIPLWGGKMLLRLLDNIRYEFSMENKNSLKQKIENVQFLYNSTLMEILDYNSSVTLHRREKKMCLLLKRKRIVALFIYLKFEAIRTLLFGRA